MTENEIKHQAKLAEWKERILECRSQRMPVATWCAQNGYHNATYYKWEREIFGIPWPKRQCISLWVSGCCPL